MPKNSQSHEHKSFDSISRFVRGIQILQSFFRNRQILNLLPNHVLNTDARSLTHSLTRLAAASQSRFQRQVRTTLDVYEVKLGIDYGKSSFYEDPSSSG